MGTPIYKTATNSCPRKCQCGKKLPRPKHGYPWVVPSVVFGEWPDHKAPVKGPMWFAKCECHRVYVWSFPNVWVIRSIHPLFDTKEVVG